MTPLFIALKTEFFESFRSGEKTEELRTYGPRWNERTCTPGRPATLSRGYGRHERIAATVKGFAKRPAASLNSEQRKAVLKIFGTLKVEIAVITLTINSEGKVPPASLRSASRAH